MKKLTDNQITEAIHRVCMQGEPIKVVAADLNVNRRTVEKVVAQYEAREVAA